MYCHCQRSSIACAAAAWLAAAPAAFAGGNVDALLACRAIASAEARLACFDREASAFAAETPRAVAPAGAQAQPAPPPGLPDPKQSFGLTDAAITEREVAAGVRPAPVTRIEAHLRELSIAADGRLVFALDNGQTWTQLRPEGGELLAKAGDAGTIKRGALGSYWRELPSRRGCKVTRLH